MSTKDDSVSIERLIKRFEGEWLALRVTERDRRFFPLRAVLVDHDKERGGLAARVSALPEVYLKYAGDVLAEEERDYRGVAYGGRASSLGRT